MPLVAKPQKSILAQTIGSPRIFSVLPIAKPRKSILAHTIGSPSIFSMLLAQLVHGQPIAKPRKRIWAQTIGSLRIFYMLSVQSIHTVSSWYSSQHHPDAYHCHMIILIIIIAETEASFWCSSHRAYIHNQGSILLSCLEWLLQMCPITFSWKYLLSK